MQFRVLIVVSAIAVTALGSMLATTPQVAERDYEVSHDAYEILTQTYALDMRDPSY